MFLAAVSNWPAWSGGVGEDVGFMGSGRFTSAVRASWGSGAAAGGTALFWFKVSRLKFQD